ncbi:hypothetical protein ACV6DN_18565 [Enterobacter asburiae]
MDSLNFDKAIKTAIQGAKSLFEGREFNLEEALISDDRKLYEITLSYTVPIEALKGTSYGLQVTNPLMRRLAERKEYRTFLVDATDFSFRGFRRV